MQKCHNTKIAHLELLTTIDLKTTGWTQKHSFILSSYKIKTYWNIHAVKWAPSCISLPSGGGREK